MGDSRRGVEELTGGNETQGDRDAKVGDAKTDNQDTI